LTYLVSSFLELPLIDILVESL